MNITRNRNRPNAWTMKISDDELEAIYIALASEGQKEDYDILDPTEEQYDRLDHIWEIIRKVRSGEIQRQDPGDGIPREGQMAVSCKDCDGVFILTSRERAFFSGKGFPFPKRCKTCRANRKESKEVNSGTE